ncbi:MAG TPA: hypothetical protein DEA44_03775 [Firmicutes bacterium]|nr:hypothetical protein [Bacillota bacterium]
MRLQTVHFLPLTCFSRCVVSHAFGENLARRVDHRPGFSELCAEFLQIMPHGGKRLVLPQPALNLIDPFNIAVQQLGNPFQFLGLFAQNLI